MMETRESEPLLDRKERPEEERCSSCCGRDRRPKCIEFTFFWYCLGQSGSTSLVEQFVHSEVEGKYQEWFSFLDFFNINFDNVTEKNEGGGKTCDHTNSNYTSPFASVIDSSVQAQSSTWLLYFDLALTLPAIFATLIICSATDKYGRKIGIIFVSGCSSFRMLIFILTINIGLSPGFYLVANAIEGLSGSSLTMFGCCLAYIVDTSSIHTRSLRFIILQSIFTFSVSVSNVSIGFLIAWLDFTNTFWLVALVHCINTIYIAIAVPNSHPSDVITEPLKPSTRRRRSSLQAIKEETVRATKRVFGSFSVFSQDYQNHSKLKLGLLLAAFLTNAIIALGSSAVITLYMLAQPFCFDSIQMGVYNAISAFFHGAVGLIGVWILTKRLRDITLAIIGSISAILNKIVFGLAMNLFMLYLGEYWHYLCIS